MKKVLKDLNEMQRVAVETTQGPVLVLSGAGTGKTRVIIRRIAHILEKKLAETWQILALTFTNKAANEIKDRLENMGFPIKNVNWAGTFHSICLKILRRNTAAAGLRENFLVFGEEDQKTIMKKAIELLKLDVKMYQPAEWVEKISRIKDDGLELKIDGITKKIFDEYNAELARAGGVDFGDLILRVLMLFNTNKEILEKYKRQFRYILVDEFQDTNNAQMQLLKFLSDTPQKNICCVGDDDQSIYAWRGAKIKNILEFDKTFSGAKIIRLEKNYRSTAMILGAANSLIKHNRGRLGKDLITDLGVGNPVRIFTFPTDRDEARFIASAINNSRDFANSAILIRSGNLSRLFEEEFNKLNIPFRLIGAMKFYERMEIRDVIAYIRLLVYNFDNLAFERVIGKPRRGFGSVAIKKIQAYGGNLMSAFSKMPLRGKAGDARDKFISAFDFDWAALKPVDAVMRLLEKSGYLQMWRDSKDPMDSERLKNIDELLKNMIVNFDTLPEFLEDVSLMITDDKNKPMGDAVSIMTIHAAKGLEFNNVFLPAWETGVFPNQTSLDDGELEEERRLAYVAITRARINCIITNAMQRMIYGKTEYNSPSGFIDEIDDKYKTFGTQNQMYETPRINAVPRKKISNGLVGKLVRHKQMGGGVVIEDNGDILVVAFRANGIKKVARKFLDIV
ncbi:MAG: UvrD-helicase domain-containing protein [Rickettsiales bacterium]|jgi:DNA helicase-2/ATP-dependent DNA helicase PcrA|nr:UvrD-helicase domain-containing protein [Rickettsiales bacterium]